MESSGSYMGQLIRRLTGHIRNTRIWSCTPDGHIHIDAAEVNACFALMTDFEIVLLEIQCELLPATKPLYS